MHTGVGMRSRATPRMRRLARSVALLVAAGVATALLVTLLVARDRAHALAEWRNQDMSGAVELRRERTTGIRRLSASGWPDQIRVEYRNADHAILVHVPVLKRSDDVVSGKYWDVVVDKVRLGGEPSVGLWVPESVTSSVKSLMWCGSDLKYGCLPSQVRQLVIETWYEFPFYQVEVTDVGITVVLPGAEGQRAILAELESSVLIVPVISPRAEYGGAVPDPELLSVGPYAERERQLDPIFAYCSMVHGIDPALAKTFAWAESRWNPFAVSDKGAQGVMQLMPATQAKYGLTGEDWKNPLKNICAGTQLIGELYKELGSIRLTAAAYNGGRDAVAPSRSCPGKLAFECEPPPGSPALTDHHSWWNETRPYADKMARLYLAFRDGFPHAEVREAVADIAAASGASVPPAPVVVEE